jgi:hypothetical protein
LGDSRGDYVAVIFADMSEVARLARDLAGAGAAMEEVSDEILDKVAADVKAAAVSDAPVLTGELRDSIWIRKGKSFRKVGSSTRQGVFQEFGTSRHGPQPWLYHNGEKGGAEIADSLLSKADRL